MNVSRDHGDAVCEGCLSQNPQTITEITEYDIKKVFYEIINILDADLSTISLHLCEECKDNIVKFLQFRRRVLDARDTINKYLSQSEANVVKTEQCTGTQSEIKSDPEEVVTTLPFVKVEVDADNHFLDDDSLDAEDLKVAAERVSAASSPRYEQSVWRCERCVLGFNHRAKLDNHMKKHDPVSTSYYSSLLVFRGAPWGR
ncbi:hypothetical protein HF086_013834 [Spodoptera exigua]|uniref:C2H2-type domain-containing protein n=1 Tax=Spodoptera exigua TaxID=7107 RepID=A0A922SCK4_SPOEX|nr:hypothetical protein HF086_013834 [Spodoptera exigua]